MVCSPSDNSLNINLRDRKGFNSNNDLWMINTQLDLDRHALSSMDNERKKKPEDYMKLDGTMHLEDEQEEWQKIKPMFSERNLIPRSLIPPQNVIRAITSETEQNTINKSEENSGQSTIFM